MALKGKSKAKDIDVSEREELLSDVNNLDEQYEMDALHPDNHKPDDAADPLVEAAMKEHRQQQHNEHKDVEEPELADDELNLDRNTFCIPPKCRNIKCGIAWTFLDENKLIDLDLTVTALDLWSFEMDSVNKDHKKMFKKSVIYNKNNKKNNDNTDDKSIDFKLDQIPENCDSLWFRINAYSGDSLKDVDKALFNIYTDDAYADEEEDEEAEEDNGPSVLYSYDIEMGFDCGAMLLGILYRSRTNKQEWKWTIVEEKNLYANLIPNNLKLIYTDAVMEQRPNDMNIKCELTQSNERYILDPNVETISIGIGWDFNTDSEDKASKKKKGAMAFDLDIDVDASMMVFGKFDKEEIEEGIEEDVCEQLDIVNGNNIFYKTYVQYVKQEFAAKEAKQARKEEKEKLINNDDDSDESDQSELGQGVAGAAGAAADDDGDGDDEVFDVFISKMNGDNDVGALCVLLNIFNDNNLQNKHKTNNVSNCYMRLFDGQDRKRELCRFSVSNINEDKKTCALVLCYWKKLDNGCWAITTNDVRLTASSNLTYQEYAKEIVLEKFSHQNQIRKSCCTIL